MEDYFQVGIVTSPHGVKGEVKVYPTTDDPARYRKLKRVLLDDGKNPREIGIASVRFFKNLVIVKFQGVESREEAEGLRQARLLVDRGHAVKLKKDEYFIADLIGLSVVSDEDEELGKIGDVLQTGANDVYVIQKKGAPDLLVPAIRECILAVDIEHGQMRVHLLPGLRDIS